MSNPNEPPSPNQPSTSYQRPPSPNQPSTSYQPPPSYEQAAQLPPYQPPVPPSYEQATGLPSYQPPPSYEQAAQLPPYQPPPEPPSYEQATGLPSYQPIDDAMHSPPPSYHTAMNLIPPSYDSLMRNRTLPPPQFVPTQYDPDCFHCRHLEADRQQYAYEQFGGPINPDRSNNNDDQYPDSDDDRAIPSYPRAAFQPNAYNPAGGGNANRGGFRGVRAQHWESQFNRNCQIFEDNYYHLVSKFGDEDDRRALSDDYYYSPFEYENWDAIYDEEEEEEDTEEDYLRQREEPKIDFEPNDETRPRKPQMAFAFDGARGDEERLDYSNY